MDLFVMIVGPIVMLVLLYFVDDENKRIEKETEEYNNKPGDKK